MGHRSRRDFLKQSAAVTAATTLGLHRSAFASAPKPPAIPLTQFGYGDVQLLDGAMLEQFRHQHALLMGLNEDSLLKPFRELGGLPAPGADMGGWYSPASTFHPEKGGSFDGYVPGHCFGQWLSALSRAYAITGDKPTQAKVQRLVKGFGGSVTTQFYADYNLPGYICDKNVIGLIDAQQFAGDANAFAVLDRMTDAVLPYLPEKSLTRDEMMERKHPNISYTWDETYTLPENFYLAYQRGAGDRYRTLAKRFLHDGAFFTPLSEDHNVLPGQHAYSHVNALSSAMQAYFTDGSEKHLRAARNGFRFVQEQSYATGGWGPNETFQQPGGNGLAQSLHNTHASFETPCGSYGQFKITRYLMRATGESIYGDSMETVLYNTILGARPTLPDGTTFYYSDYNADATKFYAHDHWSCCSGTFTQVTADYGISSYLRDPAGIYVNLYVPSRVTWQQGNARVSLTQITSYPHASETAMHLRLDRTERFTVALRIPAWAGPGTRVSVNGRNTNVETVPGTWARLDRTWRNGDRVEITFDMPLRLAPLDPQHPNIVALMRGPVALFAVAQGDKILTPQQMLASKSNGPDFVVQTNSGDVVMRPFTALHNEHFRLYQETVST